MNVANGRAACGFVDEIAKITWRIGQLRGTIGNGWKAVRQLPILAEILLQQVVKAL